MPANCTCKVQIDEYEDMVEMYTDYCSLHSAAETLYAALESVEFIDPNTFIPSYCCPKCGRSKREGHIDICGLAAALRAARGEE